MTHLIDKSALVSEIDRLHKVHSGKYGCDEVGLNLEYLEDFINTLEVKEVDLEKESELIANGIMISVQSNKYGTNIYNTERNDFNYHHLQMAARKGIELGLKAQEK